jgi:hypothetical protein
MRRAGAGEIRCARLAVSEGPAPSRPTSARLVFASSRWLRHQRTEESGFLGPNMVATSPNRASVAGRTTMLIRPDYAWPSPGKRAHRFS